MSLILFVSLLLSVVATIASLAVMRRMGDRRILILTALIALTTVRQAIMLATAWTRDIEPPFTTAQHVSELTELLVSLLILMIVVNLERFRKSEQVSDQSSSHQTSVRGQDAINALLESEQRYRYFVEQTQEGFYRLDFSPPISINQPVDDVVTQMYESGFIVECNDVYAQMYGFDDAESMNGTRLVDLHGGANVPENFEALREFVRSNYRHIDIETAEVSSSGKLVYLANNSIGIIEDETFKSCWGTQQDITEKKQADRALQESELLFRTIFEQAALGVGRFDSGSGVLLQINNRYAEILGSSVDSLLGKTWMEMIPPDVLPVGLHNMEQLRSGAVREFVVERQHERPDGMRIDLKLTVSPLWEAGAEPSTHLVIAEDVTKHRVAERAVRSSEERYRSLVVSSAATVWVTDPEGRFIEPQPMWEKFTGQSWEQHQGFGWGAALHEDDAAHMTSTWKMATQDPQEFFTEGRIFHTETQTYRHCEVRATPLVNEAGGVREWIGTTIDVQDRRSAQLQVREQLRTGKLMLSTMLDGFIFVDSAGILVDANPAYCKLLGYDQSALIGMNIRELDAALTPTELDQRFDVISKSSGGSQFETRHRHRDGHLVDLEVSLTVVPAKQQDGPLMASFLRDITARKQAERELIASREQLKAQFAEVDLIYRTAPAGMCLLDSNLRYIRINEMLAAFHGFPADEHYGMHIRDVVPELADRLIPMYTSVIESGEPQLNVEIERVDAEDPERNISFLTSCYPLKNPDGSVLGISIVVQNITALKKAEGEVLRMQDELIHAARITTMSEMAAGISHELNQPLSAIANFAQASLAKLKKSNGRIAEEVPGYLEQISELAHESGSVIRGLREFTKRQPRQSLPTSINELIHSTLEMLRFELRHAEVSVTVELPDADIVTNIDPVQIRQVLVNLINNAIDVMKPNEPENRTLQLSAKQSEDSLHVQIKDEGPGIPVAQLEHIFEPFVCNKPNGTGLGMSISSRIVKAHQGAIGARNDKDGGATVWFSIPLDRNTVE